MNQSRIQQMGGKGNSKPPSTKGLANAKASNAKEPQLQYHTGRNGTGGHKGPTHKSKSPR